MSHRTLEGLNLKTPPPRARQLSGTRLKVSIADDSLEANPHPATDSSRLTLIPPSDGEVGEASLPKLAALTVRGEALLEELELEALEQSFLNREPSYFALSEPPVTDAAPAPLAPWLGSHTATRRVLAVALLALSTVAAIWFLLLH